MTISDADDPLIGQVLHGRFEIVSRIGAGGMGRVYKAIQLPLNRSVALKVLSPKHDGSKDPGFEKRFFLEASMTAKLKHANTITVHDYGRTDDGVYYIAMELLEGETLQQTISRDGPMAWHRALLIAAQVARSLREAHKLGMVHRDLKPANIMLLPEGTSGDVVKVLDFGLVKSFTPDTERNIPPELTQQGVLLGSPIYMAPEQAKGIADARTDIYALGVVMFQSMVGRPPFQGKESIDIIVKHIREKPPTLKSLVADVPDEVNALVGKCLAKQPEQRFQSMEEFLETVRGIMTREGMSGIFADPRSGNAPVRASVDTEPNEVSHSLIRTRRVRKRVIAAVAAVMVLGAAIGGVIAVRRSGGGAVSGPERGPNDVHAAGGGAGGGGGEVAVPVKLPTDVPPGAAVDPSEVTPVIVTFKIESDPPGAAVVHAGTVIGTTPTTLDMQKPKAGPASAELTFALDGYVTETLIAQGSEGTIPVMQQLKKKPRVPPTKKGTQGTGEGYKDNPYQ